MTDEQKTILEQYKMFVEMADRVSTKRGQANMFYISLLSGIIIVEFLQYITRRGVFDIDDIVLNSLGVFIGFKIYKHIIKT